MEKIKLAIIFLILIVGAGIYYQFEVTKGDAELAAKQAVEISIVEKPVEELKADVIADETAPVVPELIEMELDCLICHEESKTKSFHVPQIIIKINERDGKRRRTCVDCHGPLGPPWSADKQMTPLNLLLFDESVGKNGVLQVDDKVPHAIHKGKLDSGTIKCQTCHGEDIEMIIPTPDTQAGQILVCQNCKFHPEGGNYITIHLQIAGKKCITCHTGGIINVHKAKTDKLGEV
jgi:nitrate reductase cytochrome c-type subunit